MLATIQLQEATRQRGSSWHCVSPAGFWPAPVAVFEDQSIEGGEFQDSTFSDCDFQTCRLLTSAVMVLEVSRSNWTPKEISLLGTKPDAERAAILGRSVESVHLKRPETGEQSTPSTDLDPRDPRGNQAARDQTRPGR